MFHNSLTGLCSLQVAFTKPCLVKGIVKKASLEVKILIKCQTCKFLSQLLVNFVCSEISHRRVVLTAALFIQGMKESYELFRELLLDHLKMLSGGPSSRGPGNGRRPAVPQLLLLLLLGASILLLFMVRHTLTNVMMLITVSCCNECAELGARV